jgi:hypothetical protein
MNRNVQSLLALQAIQCLADLLDRLIATIHRTPHNSYDADGVFVTELDRFFRCEMIASLLHRDQARLDIPVATEFFPADLNINTHYQIGTVG